MIGTGSIIGLDERVHAKIDGENCYGPAKLRMIEEWLQKSGLERGHVRFYSDHASDAPVFEWADEAVAVNPHAGSRGWRSSAAGRSRIGAEVTAQFKFDCFVVDGSQRVMTREGAQVDVNSRYLDALLLMLSNPGS